MALLASWAFERMLYQHSAANSLSQPLECENNHRSVFPSVAHPPGLNAIFMQAAGINFSVYVPICTGEIYQTRYSSCACKEPRTALQLSAGPLNPVGLSFLVAYDSLICEKILFELPVMQPPGF